MKKENLKMMKMTDYCSTYHCEGVRKHDCCNPVFRVEKNLDCHAHFRSLAMTGKKKAAFTLAETLITLTILGVIAAITVPMLINKQMEAANRTKLKKAMAAYEKALNQMIIDNDIKSGPISAIEGFRAADNCSTSTTYFKKINGDGCRFQTADKVWWDITDIEHPLISLKDEITDENIATLKGNADSLDDDKTSFIMVGEIKDGIVRINDKGATTETPDKNYLYKVYSFINNDQREEQEVSCDNTISCNNGSCTLSDCKGNVIDQLSYKTETNQYPWGTYTTNSFESDSVDFYVDEYNNCSDMSDLNSCDILTCHDKTNSGICEKAGFTVKSELSVYNGYFCRQGFHIVTGSCNPDE